jgi:hypothetical protein
MKHPQADLIMQVATIRAKGMCEHWESSIDTSYGKVWVDFTEDCPLNSDLYSRTIRMKPSHPDYNTDKNPNRPKPELKQIDMSMLPVGTMTNYGEIIEVTSSTYILYEFANGKSGLGYWSKHSESIRLAEQTKWTAWTGGECPVPEGCKYEWMDGYGEIFSNMDVVPEAWRWLKHKDGYRVASYRITGVADGWTDGSL